MGRYKSRELVHFGVDYIKVQIEVKKWKLPRKLLLSRNTTMSYYDDDTIIELMPDMMSWEYKRFYQIRDAHTNVSLCFLAIGWEKKWMLTRSDFLEVTGQGLILRGWYQYFVDMMKAFKIKIWKYIRADICMDIAVDTQYFLETIVWDYYKKKTTTPFITKGIIHALYVGEKQLKKNTYQFIRIYNKKLDNINKAKEWLYEQYKDYTNVTRLEVELRRDKACFLTTEKLLNVWYIFGIIVRTFYPMNNQFFSFFHQEDFEKLVEKKGIWKKRVAALAERKRLQDFFWIGFKNEKEKNTYIKTFISYARKLHINGLWIEKLKWLIDENVWVMVSLFDNTQNQADATPSTSSQEENEISVLA